MPAACKTSTWKRELWPVVGSPDGTSDGEVFETPKRGMIPVSLSEPSSATWATPVDRRVPDSTSTIPDPLDAYSVSQARTTQRLRVRKPRKGPATPLIARRCGPIVGIRSIIQTMSKKIVGWRGIVEQKFGISVVENPTTVGAPRTRSNIVGSASVFNKNKFVGGFKRRG